MNIQEFRKKYPVYDNLSDKELSDKVYKKYYTNLPRQEFNKRFGYEEEHGTKGLKGISRDVLEGALNVPGAIGDFLTSLPGEAIGAGHQIYSNPKRVVQNVGTGLAQGGAGLLGLPGTIRDYLANKGIISEESPSFRLPEKVLPKDYDYGKALGREGKEAGDALITGLTESLPYSLLGELGLAGKGIGRKTLQRSAAQGAMGAAAEQNPITSALMVPAAKGGTDFAKLIGGELSKLTKPKIKAINNYLREQLEIPEGQSLTKHALEQFDPYKTHLTPEQLEEKLRVTQGTNTHLGEVLESPHLKRKFENKLARTAFSGADEALHEMAQHVNTKGEKAISSLIGERETPTDVNKYIKEKLDESYKKSTKKKSNLYNKVSESQKEEDLKLELPTFKKAANERKDIIEEQKLLHANPKSRRLYEQLAGYENAAKGTKSSLLNEKGEPISVHEESPSISEANILAGQLSYIGKTLKHSLDPSNKHKANVYSDLSKSLKNDIKNTLMEKGSPKIQQEFKEAEANFGGNHAKFLDEEVFPYITGKKSAQSIVSDLVSSGTKDATEKLDKFLDILNPGDRHLIGYAYLKKSYDKDGNLNPTKLRGLIEKLGPRQFASLFPDEATRTQLKDFSKLERMNLKAINRLANPPTGQQSLDVTPGLLSKILSSVTGGKLGGAAGSIGGLLAGTYGPGIAAKPVVKKLTSEAEREKIVKDIINKKTEKKKTPQEKKHNKHNEERKKLLADSIYKSMVPLEIELNRYAKKESD